MAITCPTCQYNIEISKALCDDWRDPNRSFGCPNCGTFYVKDMNPSKKYVWLIGISVGGIFMPALWVLLEGIKTSDTLLMGYGGLIMLALFPVLAIALSPLMPLRGQLEPSGYQRPVATPAAD